jgi:hypothetical protein
MPESGCESVGLMLGWTCGRDSRCGAWLCTPWILKLGVNQSLVYEHRDMARRKHCCTVGSIAVGREGPVKQNRGPCLMVQRHHSRHQRGTATSHIRRLCMRMYCFKQGLLVSTRLFPTHPSSPHVEMPSRLRETQLRALYRYEGNVQKNVQKQGGGVPFQAKGVPTSALVPTAQSR